VWGCDITDLTRERSEAKQNYYLEYKRWQQEQLNKEKLERAQRQQQKRQLRDNRLKQKAARCLDILKMTTFSRVSDYITVVLLMLGILLIPLKLDDTIKASWALVLIPWYLIFVQFLAIVGVYDVLHLYFHKKLEWSGPLGYPLALWKVVFHFRFMRDLVWVTFFFFLAFFVLIAVKLGLDGTSHSFGWWGVWIPIWLLFCFYCSVPLYGGCGNSRIKGNNFCVRLLAIAGIFVPGFFFLIFIFLRVQGVTASWSLYTVFIPFWIIFGLLFCAGVAIGLYCCFESHLSITELALLYTGIFVFFASFFIWMIVWCAKVQQQTTAAWIVAFIPLVFWSVWSLFGCVAADIYFVWFQ